jgi:hypothetical protein
MPRRRLILAVILAVGAIAPRAGRTDSALEELAAGATLATGTAPGSMWVSDRLAGVWDIDPRWQLRLDLSTTRALGDAGDTARDDVYLGALAVAYAPDEHWSLRLSGGWSPEASTRAIAQVDAGGLFVDAMGDARLRAAVSSVALGAGIDYDSASDDVHAMSASLSLGATYFQAQQEILDIAEPGAGATLDAAAIRMRCAVAACSSAVTGALSPQWLQLGQFALGASITDTIDGDTDLSLDASYYLYDRDPLQFGYYALATIARSTLGSATSAPLLRDAISPGVSHRWGSVAASVNLAYADYVDGREYDVSASLRIQVKIALADARRLRLYVKLASDAHGDASSELTHAASVGLGAQYAW